MACAGCMVSVTEVIEFSQTELFEFLRRHNVIRSERFCPKCGAQCKFSSTEETKFFFTCLASHMHQQKQKSCESRCNFYEALRANTFAGTQFTAKEICRFVAFDTLRIKGETDLLMVYDDWSITNSRPKLGGVSGVVVEIDEAKFEAAKYSCCRVVEGQWLFGGIERESGDFFIVPVESRSTESLLSIIKERVADGSTIISDCWRAYNCLESEEFVHQTVNHSKTFVDPKTQAHTKNIERLWRDMKDSIPDSERKGTTLDTLQNSNFSMPIRAT
ncbi:hypothetical protein ACLKA7_000891 [Drosophila subpalustris]